MAPAVVPRECHAILGGWNVDQETSAVDCALSDQKICFFFRPALLSDGNFL
jgi:hypothetical protein